MRTFHRLLTAGRLHPAGFDTTSVSCLSNVVLLAIDAIKGMLGFAGGRALA
jgi:hypothetical protein